jgi:hypothetical protein
VDTGPEAGLGSTPLVFHRVSPGTGKVLFKENQSTGHQRLNPDRACKRGNDVYTLHEDDTAHKKV